jgi:GNAT superfamily N-acetyltransferase
MSNDPQFRRAGESDAETLLDFMRAYYAFDGHGFDREKARGALTALLQDANLGFAWLILDGDAAVGYVVRCFGYSLEWLGRDAFVDEFYLREEYRGRGWGRATMEFMEECRASGGGAHAALGSGAGEFYGIAGVSEAGVCRAREYVSVEMDCAGFFQAAGAELALIRRPPCRFAHQGSGCLGIAELRGALKVKV